MKRITHHFSHLLKTTPVLVFSLTCEHVKCVCYIEYQALTQLLSFQSASRVPVFTETAGGAPSVVGSTGGCCVSTDTPSTSRSAQRLSPTATATHTSVSTPVVTSTQRVAAASKRCLDDEGRRQERETQVRYLCSDRYKKDVFRSMSPYT